MRTIAIVHVVLAHGAMAFLSDFPGPGGKLVWLLIAANFGVPLFFVLSGFLITRQLAAGMPLGTFYRHRLAKIYPTFFVAVLVFGLLGGVSDIRTWLLHLLALHNGSSAVSGKVSGHFWSLAVEMQFYAIAPLLFALGYRWLTPRSASVLAAAVWLGHAWLLLATPATQGARLAAVLDVYQFTSFNILALILGGLLYRTYASEVDWRFAWPVGLLAAAAMPLICATVVPSLLVTQVDLTRNGPLLAVLALISLPPVASVCLAYLTLRGRWFCRSRWRPIAAFFSAISYQWYLWHPLVLLAFHRASARWPDVEARARAWPWVALLIYGLACALVGWLAYRGLEQPLHRWLLKSRRAAGDLPRTAA